MVVVTIYMYGVVKLQLGPIVLLL